MQLREFLWRIRLWLILKLIGNRGFKIPAEEVAVQDEAMDYTDSLAVLEYVDD